MKRRLALTLFLLACCALPAEAQNCSVSATGVTFTLVALGESTTNGIIRVNCTRGLAYTVGLNAGTTGGGTVTARLMAGPGGAYAGLCAVL
jgi:spore coat protein U-like protein